MTKKGPLSKAEKYYIENHRDLEIKNLCKDLDRAQSIVKSFLGKLAQQEAPKDTLLYQQFARNEKGSTVMTETASEMADGKRVQFNEAKHRSRCITPIKK